VRGSSSHLLLSRSGPTRLSPALALLLTLVAPASALADDVDAPSIVHDEIRAGRLGHPLLLRATITDESGVFDPVLLYRVGEGAEFLRLPLVPVEGEADLYEATIPGEIVSGDLQYFIEAFDNNGNGPARYGDEALPIKIAVLTTAEPLPDAETPTTSDEPVAAEPEGGGGLWIGLGVGAGAVLLIGVAVAAAAGGYFLLRPPVGPTQVDVIITAPTPTSGGSP